jgi:hypothetical protein
MISCAAVHISGGTLFPEKVSTQLCSCTAVQPCTFLVERFSRKSFHPAVQLCSCADVHPSQNGLTIFAPARDIARHAGMLRVPPLHSSGEGVCCADAMGSLLGRATTARFGSYVRTPRPHTRAPACVVRCRATRVCRKCSRVPGIVVRPPTVSSMSFTPSYAPHRPALTTSARACLFARRSRVQAHPVKSSDHVRSTTPGQLR